MLVNVNKKENRSSNINSILKIYTIIGIEDNFMMKGMTLVNAIYKITPNRTCKAKLL